MTTYTHGLEKIYQFEVVNPSSVKPLPYAIKAAIPEQKIENPLTPTTDARELTFDFGPKFATSMPSLRLDEPLEVLHLSVYAQKALLLQGFKTIRDIVNTAKEKLPLGLGHVEEVTHKIQNYLV